MAHMEQKFGHSQARQLDREQFAEIWDKVGMIVR